MIKLFRREIPCQLRKEIFHGFLTGWPPGGGLRQTSILRIFVNVASVTYDGRFKMLQEPDVNQSMYLDGVSN
ncbi:hypothetical protein E2C01_032625 [Portunus trituberculatus]|uniref:Uncharacterized protein n=1 Tax=Portunus trituberculatus TaxID=210409 RepID=A0A5B7F047_PORTR|nr:hypothetical protein [Portunus trituberculatus]